MEEMIARAWQIRQANFPKEIEFAFPAKTRAISVTGTQCQLNCAHCNGRYLEKMITITDWRKKLSPDTTSCLISFTFSKAPKKLGCCTITPVV